MEYLARINPVSVIFSNIIFCQKQLRSQQGIGIFRGHMSAGRLPRIKAVWPRNGLTTSPNLVPSGSNVRDTICELFVVSIIKFSLSRGFFAGLCGQGSTTAR